MANKHRKEIKKAGIKEKLSLQLNPYRSIYVYTHFFGVMASRIAWKAWTL